MLCCCVPVCAVLCCADYIFTSPHVIFSPLRPPYPLGSRSREPSPDAKPARGIPRKTLVVPPRRSHPPAVKDSRTQAFFCGSVVPLANQTRYNIRQRLRRRLMKSLFHSLRLPGSPASLIHSFAQKTTFLDHNGSVPLRHMTFSFRSSLRSFLICVPVLIRRPSCFAPGDSITPVSLLPG